MSDGDFKYRVTVKRMQVWHLDVEAADIETARDKADDLACDEPPHDDYAYETTAKRDFR